MQIAKSLTLLLLLFNSTTYAIVRSCILDGGGPISDRVCNVEEAVDSIRSIYTNMGVQARTSILTGPGRRGAMACTTQMLGCTNPDNPATCTPGALDSETWDAQLGRYRPVPATAQVSLELRARRGESLRSADQQSFHENCLFNSDNPPQQKIPVCHFWNLNHGSPQGSLFYRQDNAPQTYMTNDMLRSKADHCQTFRFVTHSCYGGQLSRLIYGADGRVLPGRCGVSAMPPGYTAPGYATAQAGGPEGHRVSRRRFSAGGRQHTTQAVGWPAQTHYPLLEAFQEDSADSQSFDDVMRGLANKSNIVSDDSESMHSLQRLQPYATSDFYLADQLGNSMTGTEEENSHLTVPLERQRSEIIARVIGILDPIAQRVNQCYLRDRSLANMGDILTLANTSLTQLSTQNLTSEEIRKIEQDLTGELDRFTLSQQILCLAVDGERPVEGADTATSMTPELLNAVLERSMDIGGAMNRCNAEDSYNRFVRERKAKLRQYEQLKSQAEGLQRTSTNLCRRIAVSVRVHERYLGRGYRSPDQSCNIANVDNYIREAIEHSLGGRICESPQAMVFSGFNADRPYNIREVLNRCHIPGPNMPRLQRLLEARNEYQAIHSQVSSKQQELDRHIASFEQWLAEKNHYRKYEDAKMRFSQVIQLYQNGSREQIQDYLTLRECETAPIDSNIVSQ